MSIKGVNHSRSQIAQKRAIQAERDAAKQVQLAQKRVREAQLQADQRIDDIKDHYIQRSDEERNRQDFQYTRLREKGLSTVDELKRNIRKQINTTKNQSEKDLRTIENFYQSEIYNSKHEGGKDLKSQRSLIKRTLENEKVSAESQFDEQQALHSQKINQERELHKNRMDNTREASQKDYDSLKKNYLKARNKSNTVFQQNLKESLNAHQTTLNRINRNATSRIKEIGSSYSRALDTYESRQNDPFYQLVRIDGVLAEAKDGYVFYASIPKHEQDDITVNIQGNQLVVGGTRRSQEHLDDEEGKRITTTSFQSYHETFPFNSPVDARNLSKEFDDDLLIVTVPKATHAQRPVYRKPIDEGDDFRVPRPKFPEGVEPKATKRTPQDLEDDENPGIEKANQGSITLS